MGFHDYITNHLVNEVQINIDSMGFTRELGLLPFVRALESVIGVRLFIVS